MLILFAASYYSGFTVGTIHSGHIAITEDFFAQYKGIVVSVARYSVSIMLLYFLFRRLIRLCASECHYRFEVSPYAEPY